MIFYYYYQHIAELRLMHQSQKSCLKEETVKTKLKFPTIQICFNKINRLNYTLSKTGRKKKICVY